MNILRHSTLQSAGRKPLRTKLALIPLALLLCLSVLTSSARAACGRYQAGPTSPAARLPQLPGGEDDHDFHGPEFFNPSIVGLWHVIFTAGGNTFNDSFDTWHIDGTEFETPFLAPLGGDVCVGVWKQTAPRTVVLHHIGWIFNPATPSATAGNYFTRDDVITVAPNGKTYTGTFTFKIWNLDGTPTPVEVTGTIAATRITV